MTSCTSRPYCLQFCIVLVDYTLVWIGNEPYFRRLGCRCFQFHILVISFPGLNMWLSNALFCLNYYNLRFLLAYNVLIYHSRSFAYRHRFELVQCLAKHYYLAHVCIIYASPKISHLIMPRLGLSCWGHRPNINVGPYLAERKSSQELCLLVLQIQC